MSHTRLSAKLLADCFPVHGKFRGDPRPEQEEMMAVIGDGVRILEAPTGSGKSPVERALMDAASETGCRRPCWITPTKALVDQFKADFPDLTAMVGSNDVPCMFAMEEYDPETPQLITPEQLAASYENPAVLRRDAVPCTMINGGCPHFVDPETGHTLRRGATPCPYYQQLYQAKQGGPVVCTTAFYLFARLFTKKFEDVDALVIDECHRMGDIVRRCLSYDISDWHIEQCIELLQRIEATREMDVLERFLRTFRRMAKARKREPFAEHLLTDDEVRLLIEILQEIDVQALKEKVQKARRDKVFLLKTEAPKLKRLQTLVSDIPRYIHSFAMSIPDDEAGRGPLDYTCAFYRAEEDEHHRVQYKLVVRSHFVAPLIRKRLLPDLTVSFSATIGDPEILSFDTGIRGSFHSLGSTFPVERTRIYCPSDAPDFSYNKPGSKRQKTVWIRRVAVTCKKLARRGIRSLVVFISDAERQKFLEFAVEESLQAISYGNGIAAKDAVAAFKEGAGDALVGTASNYAEGIDLPKGIAPMIFYLRPGFPNPNDAMCQFEAKKFSQSRIWALRRWRETLRALQVRGRNVRSDTDVGFFVGVDKRLRGILQPNLPSWLEGAYVNDLTFDQCIADAIQRLGK